MAAAGVITGAVFMASHKTAMAFVSVCTEEEIVIIIMHIFPGKAKALFGI